MSAGLHAWPVEGIGEVLVGTDLADLLVDVDLRDGDVVVVTSKVVAKAEDRVRSASRPQDKDAAVDEESVRVVAQRGGTRIVEHHLGLVMAAAGVDGSNVVAGHLVLLPLDPDASARRLRESLHERRGVDVAVVITDTAGRAWRTGQTDLAVGLAGLDPLEAVADTDGYGNPLVVTAPAVADEVACVAELVTGKTAGRPVSVVRGLGDRLLPTDAHGPGARALVRPRSQDMFALGSREAVLAALAGDDEDCFGTPVPAEELLEQLRGLGVTARSRDGDGVAVHSQDPTVRERARLAAHALAWRASVVGNALVLEPRPVAT